MNLIHKTLTNLKLCTMGMAYLGDNLLVSS